MIRYAEMTHDVNSVKNIPMFGLFSVKVSIQFDCLLAFSVFELHFVILSCFVLGMQRVRVIGIPFLPALLGSLDNCLSFASGCIVHDLYF